MTGPDPAVSTERSSVEVHQAIAQAKQDWESTADSLPHVICLLDEQRRAIRVNRGIETWHLGHVNHVLGRDMPDLLHPGGWESDCTLRALLYDAWERAQNGASAEFETFDSHLQRNISVALRPISEDPSG